MNEPCTYAGIKRMNSIGIIFQARHRSAAGLRSPMPARYLPVVELPRLEALGALEAEAEALEALEEAEAEAVEIALRVKSW